MGVGVGLGLGRSLSVVCGRPARSHSKELSSSHKCLSCFELLLLRISPFVTLELTTTSDCGGFFLCRRPHRTGWAHQAGGGTYRLVVPKWTPLAGWVPDKGARLGAKEVSERGSA